MTEETDKKSTVTVKVHAYDNDRALAIGRDTFFADLSVMRAERISERDGREVYKARFKDVECPLAMKYWLNREWLLVFVDDQALLESDIERLIDASHTRKVDYLIEEKSYYALPASEAPEDLKLLSLPVPKQ